MNEQDCVVEYYALHFEKTQQEALRVLEPPLRRSILTLNVGHSDEKTLVKFAEIDEALTRCSQELMEALEALGIEALTSALRRLPRLGPSLAYCFYEHEKKGAFREDANETEGEENMNVHYVRVVIFISNLTSISPCFCCFCRSEFATTSPTAVSWLGFPLCRFPEHARQRR